MMATIYDIAIVGGGIVGLSVAYKLTQKYPDLKVAILEKESEIALHQTGHNSGVIHAGIYYQPGSYRARLCREGRAQLIEFAQHQNIKFEICGKLIVAADESERSALTKLYQRGIENGLQDLRLVSGDELKSIEPACTGSAGIWVSETGLIDYHEVSTKLLQQFLGREGRILVTGAQLEKITKQGSIVSLVTTRGVIRCKHFIACAGLQCDRVAALDGLRLGVRIVPFRGDYYRLNPSSSVQIRNMIYPVPNPEFPFLGVHFTRTIHNMTKCGPNAVLSFAREGYHKLALNLRDSASCLSFVGTWRLCAKHWKYGLMEYRRALSKQLFVESAQRLVPSICAADLIPAKPGIRANLVSVEGKVVDDFMFEQTEHAIHVLNTPSPAATACLSIADVVVEKTTNAFTF